jgi:hypothetical protein
MAPVRRHWKIKMQTTNAGPVSTAKSLSNHLGKLLIATHATDRRLYVIARLGAVNDIAGRPAYKVFSILSGQLGEQNAAISRYTASLDPILNRLVRDAHLPRHVGNGVELRDGSLECRVLLAHGFCQRLLNLKTILAQASLVPQVTFQLPQAFPVETIAI